MLTLEISQLQNHVRLTVNVKTRSREDKLIVGLDGTITVHVVAPPVEGKANRMIIRILAKKLGRTNSQVRIVAGHRSNVKIVEIANMSEAELTRLMKPLHSNF